jgi:hypothetical protein
MLVGFFWNPRILVLSPDFLVDWSMIVYVLVISLLIAGGRVGVWHGLSVPFTMH